MNRDPFENQLAQIPLRELPPELKETILAQARKNRSASLNLFAAINWRTLLWPHPWAWATLAVIWLMIAGLNGSGPHGPELYAVNPAEIRPGEFSTERYAAYLRARNRLLAQGFDTASVVWIENQKL